MRRQRRKESGPISGLITAQDDAITCDAVGQWQQLGLSAEQGVTPSNTLLQAGFDEIVQITV